MRIGPILSRAISEFCQRTGRSRYEIESILQRSPSDMKTLLKDHELRNPKLYENWNLQPWYDQNGVLRGYEMRVGIGNVKVVEFVENNICEHHLPVDLPETVLVAAKGKPASDVFAVGPDFQEFWTGSEIIVGRQRTNDINYLIVDLSR